ncbi:MULTISPECIES: ribose 5-phosphate isomerase B [Alkalihalophilus]|uniref:Ribose-5-phosphate isomerase B n=1 Tax=Alkalihalophilus pseudofirmus (strain ATCC BAA-2126 / JCM 17055 / OF4) TaxID=398511 RepID=D3FZT4_ALKPO|nr:MULTISPECIES: ribose 5-phosphate isomerase B [Alkalihalophilus]ADC49326.1 ribose-5-phosphate isomerase B [Alkalihalophilus pseudofirmus OF4]MEC2071406.1 ribose 5-phosphate isomerase B [Alkalihalophilus marmarensis]
MKLAVGSDHAGFPLKASVLEFLEKEGHEVIDFGSYTPDPVDFPVITKQVCQAVLDGKAERGIMICGTGVGASIAANKVPGIRASVCHDIYTAHQCVEHDDVNVMAIGAQIIGHTVANELIERFLAAEFSTKEEFRRRVEMLHEMDKGN